MHIKINSVFGEICNPSDGDELAIEAPSAAAQHKKSTLQFPFVVFQADIYTGKPMRWMFVFLTKTRP
jgi:hypothetical protein